MGHRPFEGKQEDSKQSTNFVSVSQARQFEQMSKKNGIVQLTEEQESHLQSTRQALLDEVSKRMGELLLKGHTMLDDYCQECSGILMEDRSGVRRCVQCEVQREYLQKQQGSTDFIEEELEDMQNEIYIPSFSNTAEDSEPSTVEPRDQKRNETKVDRDSVVRTYKHKEKNPVHMQSSHKKAMSAVQRKLEWATTQLEMSEDLDKIPKYIKIIERSVECLKSWK